MGTVLDRVYAQSANGAEVERHAGLVRVRVNLTGQSPLLQNAMTQDELLSLWDKEGKKAKTAARPQPREHADKRVHRLHDGRPCVPVKNVYASFIAAGEFVRLDGQKQVSTKDTTRLPGMLTVEDAELPLFKPGKDEPAEWEVDIQQGRNPNGGEAVCIIRPRFDAWELRLVIEVDQSVMPLTMAYKLVQIAGTRVGLCDFRPQRKGTFGRSVISLWEQIEG